MFVGTLARLRGLERGDLRPMVMWMNDPEVQQKLARATTVSMAEHERWFEALLRSSVEVVFAIDDVSARHKEHSTASAEPRFVGTCGLHRIDWRNRHAAVSIVIGDVAGRGHGVGSDALRMLCDHAFLGLGLHRLELEVVVDNDDAIRCYRRLGFVLEGTRRECVFVGGAFADLHTMALLSSAWTAKETPQTASKKAPKKAPTKPAARPSKRAERRGSRTSA